MRAVFAVGLATLCACGDNAAPAPGSLLSCEIQFPQGMKCLKERPFLPPSDCEWSHSCAHWTYCTCVDDHYDCRVMSLDEGAACDGDEVCHPTCEEPTDRDRWCSCVDGAIECTEGRCPQECPVAPPDTGEPCDIAVGIRCEYQDRDCACSADGSWLCAV